MYDLNATCMFCKHIKMKQIFFKSMLIDKISRKIMRLLYIIYMPHKFSGNSCVVVRPNQIENIPIVLLILVPKIVDIKTQASFRNGTGLTQTELYKH